LRCHGATAIELRVAAAGESGASRVSVGIHPAPFERMNHDTLEQFRQTLLDRRTSLLKRWRQALSDANELLVEREPDWQDAAAAVTAASVLDTIGERGRRALARIQFSLARIERDSYDECSVCHGTIDEERLRAVPETDRCGRCALEN
jgi:RNA polymerase-binding transcription factor DksA